MKAVRHPSRLSSSDWKMTAIKMKTRIPFFCLQSFCLLLTTLALHAVEPITNSGMKQTLAIPAVLRLGPPDTFAQADAPSLRPPQHLGLPGMATAL
jgi:hypothetical protein